MQETIWFVFSPCHGTYVLAVDEEHAWRVAKEPQDMHPRRIVRKAEFRNGLLVFDFSGVKEVPPEMRGPKASRLETVLVGKTLSPVEQLGDEPKAPVPDVIEGDRTTPKFEAPLEDKAVFVIGAGASRVGYHELLEKEPGAEVWTINDERSGEQTRHFQIHLRSAFPACSEAYFEVGDLIEKGITVYEPHTFPFGKIRRLWLNSSIDYMLALADAEGFSRIYMPGIDFGGLREPQEKASSRYWIGVLEGKGATVYNSPLYNGFDCKIYGLSELEEEFRY
jgi:hypothetical protein